MEVHDLNNRHHTDRIPAYDLIAKMAAVILKALRMVHTLYGCLVFVVLFFLFLPLLLIPVIFKSQFHLTGIFNRWWAKALFILVGLPYKLEYRFTPAPDREYVFCSNHFSYLDIPTMGLNRHNTIFVGKNSMERIPLFGFMYSRLHITVDRANLKSRYSSILKSINAVDEGKSLVIFPEGGIISTNPPNMSSFKDGAFRVAIEKQIPLVPVTIPYNWIILSDNDLLLRWHPLKVIFHEPIDTTGMTLDDVKTLKERLHNVINEELKKHFNHEN